MNGQWRGQYSGTNSGSIIVNIDDRGDHFEGAAFLIDSNKDLPSTVVSLTTIDKAKTFKLKIPVLYSINPRTRLTDAWNNVKQFYPNINFSASAEVNGSWNKDSLKLNWTTDIGVTGFAKLPKSKADKPSECVSLSNGWDEYKKYVSSMESRRYLFRGQNEPTRLRTKFHRTGRADLARFLSEDVRTLHTHLSARTRHIFNLNIPDENGAFLNLVQHHGYPTPLLDWTFSPYVAAFFAFRNISNFDAAKAPKNRKVRIIVFDQKRWRSDFEQVTILNTGFPHFSIMEFLAIDNERMIPQQAVSSVTNIDDIESYIKSKEDAGKKYLHIIDIPIKEREKVICELSYMGITAGALYPGLDGACDELKERFFGI